MRVLFVSFEYPPDITGGLGTYGEHLVEGLRKRGVDASIIAPGNRTTDSPKMHKISIPEIFYFGRYFFAKKAVRMIHHLKKYEKFDIVHFNGPYPITKKLGVPTACTFHCTHAALIKTSFQELKGVKTAKDIMDLVLKDPVASLFEIVMARVSDRIICPSLSLARELRSYCFADEQKISVIPNGFDSRTFDGINIRDTTLLNKYGIENENFLLYMGRLSYLKGVQYLIKAFEAIKKQDRNLKLVIAGKGSFEPYLRKIAHNVEGILFIGFVNSLRTKKLLYEKSLAVVLPSVGYEVSPMVVLEAMACGKPVVASDVGGIPLMINHGENGFLVKPKDSKSLASFIQSLCENPNLRKKMGMLSKKLLEKEFSVDRMVNRTLRVYDKLLSTYEA